MTQEEFFKRYTYSVSTDRIGGGGFGTVYKAKDHVLHRTVAIKVSEVKTTADGQKTFSLKDEFEALNQVPKHPNIANYEEFYSFEMPNGIFDYAVMQYYPDGNLSNAIKQGLTAEQKEDIATQLLEGIAFLHEHKVVHRDLKPGNILIVKDGENIIPLITDFGLSKAANMGDGSMFSNSFGGGTQRYSSPEQLQGKPLRLNTDLWSYGAILYELFTGEQLFSAGSGAANTAQAELEIYNKIVNGDVRSLGAMPEKWRKVAERCLVVDADKRAKDEAELFRIISGEAQEDETVTDTGNGNLQSASDDTGAVASAKPSNGNSNSGPDLLSPALQDHPKSKKGLWIALAAVAVVAALLVLLLKPKKEEPVVVATDPDTQAYEACQASQNVADYRAYMRDYGRNALHYADAKAFVDQFVADSAATAQELLAQQQAEEEAQSAKADEAENQAYSAIQSIQDCDAYLRKYPTGKYVEAVKKKKDDYKDDEVFRRCKTIKDCEYYLVLYKDNGGRHVNEVLKMKDELEKAQQRQQLSQGSNNTANGHEYVDLGLPSGTLWATCNIGANKPEGYGNYYAWGETSTKSTYNWDTYKYANGNYDKLTKYCNKSDYGNNGFTDKLTTLQSGDDPATTWGSGWRTPSKEQWEELENNTTKLWTTRGGKQGMFFTSKKNGQTLFLPAAGDRWCSELNFPDSYGIYWSRSLYTPIPRNACYLYFNSDRCYLDNGGRSSGFTVRPVRQN